MPRAQFSVSFRASETRCLSYKVEQQAATAPAHDPEWVRAIERAKQSVCIDIVSETDRSLDTHMMHAKFSHTVDCKCPHTLDRKCLHSLDSK